MSHDFIQRRDKTKVCLNEFLNGTSNLKIYLSYFTFNFGSSYKVDFFNARNCMHRMYPKTGKFWYWNGLNSKHSVTRPLCLVESHTLDAAARRRALSVYLTHVL